MQLVQPLINQQIQIELDQNQLNFTSPHNQIHLINTWNFNPKQPNSKPIIWVIHGLTGTDNPFEWWSGIFNSKSEYCSGKYAIVSVTIPNSSYSLSSPKLSDYQIDRNIEKWILSIKNVATIFNQIRTELKIESIHSLIGASLGGQIALEYAIILGNKLQQLKLIATNAKHSAWGQAYNYCQRQAIELDPEFSVNPFTSAKKGLSLARSIAMISYRTYQQYEATQSSPFHDIEELKVESYLNYQGTKIGERFSAIHYWLLTKMMDSQQLASSEEQIEQKLQQISAYTTIISFSSDILFPKEESEFLAKQIPNSKHFSFQSDYGHDAFLVEYKLVKQALFHSTNK